MHYNGVACREAAVIREATCAAIQKYIVVVRRGGSIGRRFIDSRQG